VRADDGAGNIWVALPAVASAFAALAAAAAGAAAPSVAASAQGLALVHFPAQPKPFSSPTPVPLSNRLGENHAPKVSLKMCLR
jgi:hypothetical protein